MGTILRMGIIKIKQMEMMEMNRGNNLPSRLGVASRYDLNKGQASRLVQARTLAFNFDVAGRYAEQRVLILIMPNNQFNVYAITIVRYDAFQGKER